MGRDRRSRPVHRPRVAYTAPARATDLSGLAPAFIEVGAAETFRDEAVDYASRIWATGGQAELHVWAGGYHGFSGFSPEAEVSQAAVAARESWLRACCAWADESPGAR
ncbi:alpha/beta hydrolase [Microbacterium sp. NRRL B-14842]|uniref:alpha/beta hydrolase n=1 Tax=Microbacterium sp. NRRL B-14842 TaxID=3162881 RepID=UPI003D2AD84D